MHVAKVGVSRLSLTKYAHCEACPLKGRPIVPGHGMVSRPRIAFVAEAPGETEVEQGVPLIGKSGQFLRKVIGDLGIDEDACYFTNICICHPEGNKTPTAAMARACLGRLAAELANVQPEIIVALGNVASRYLAGHRLTITRAHGMYREIELRPHSGERYSVGIVPTYHPAGVLRGPELFRDFEEELEYVRTILEGQPAIIDPPYENYEFIETQQDFDRFLKDLSQQSWASSDLETDKMDWFDARILCAGFSWAKETAHVVDWKLVEQNYRNTLALNTALSGVKLALHNGVFDIPFFIHNGLDNAYYYLDTMQAHYLLDERQGTHGLERLAIKYYRAPAYKTQFREGLGIKSFAEEEEFAGLIAASPKEDLFYYNGADTDYTYRLAVDLVEMVKAEGQLNVLQNIEMPSCRAFTSFTMSGLLVDRDYVEKLGKAWNEEEAQLVAQMKEEVGDPDFNPNSTKQLAVYMYDVLKLAPFGGREMLGKDKIDEEVISKFIQTVDDEEAREYWTSRRTVMSSGMKGFGGAVKGIQPRTTATYMLYWLRQQHTFPDLVIRWRRIRKRRSLYYDGLLKYTYADGRIRPHYNLTATRTGRKATEKPAIHNWPRGDEIYNIVIPDPGWCLIHADYSQAELRMMAHYSGDKDLIHILNTTDPHSVFAKSMFHITDEEWEKLTKAEISDKRIAAKMVTFGLPYGRSAAGLAPQLGLTKEEAVQYIDDFFKPFPVWKKWLENQRQRGVDEQMIISVFGRRRRFPLIPDKFYRKEVERMSGNMAIQSAINDLTLISYFHSYGRIADKGIPVHYGAHIHDSINLSVPKPYWVEAVKVIIEAMAEVPFETEVNFPCECEIGERWGNMITVHKGGKWIDPEPGAEIPEWMTRRGTTLEH